MPEPVFPVLPWTVPHRVDPNAVELERGRHRHRRRRHHYRRRLHWQPEPASDYDDDDDTDSEFGQLEDQLSPDQPQQISIWFEWNSTKLRQDSDTDSVVHLASVIGTVLHQAEATKAWGRIILHGFSSQEGGETHNKELSLQRALRIKSLLVESGIPEKHIRVIAHGPINDLPTLARNRRITVEFQP